VKIRLVIFFLLTTSCFVLSGVDRNSVNPFFLLTGFEDDEDTDDEVDTNEDTEEDEAVNTPKNKNMEDSEENLEEDLEETPKEEDPFAKDEPVKDEFAKEEVKKDVFAVEEDDFVQEKREKGKTHKYKEPDLAKISFPTYLYAENSIKSKKLFELYKNDEVIVLEEAEGFTKVEFLGKEGWIPTQDMRLEKWYTYRVSMELLGGAGSGGGDIKNFSVLGNYHLRLNVAVVQDFVIGGEGRAVSFDSDAFYAGGGLVLRYYIPGLRSKKSRSALTASVGYVGGMEKPGSNYEYQTGETQYKVFSGPYVDVSLDYFFRIWEYMDIGLGGYFSYVHLYGKTEMTDLEKSFYQGGAQLSFNFNILR